MKNRLEQLLSRTASPLEQKKILFVDDEADLGWILMKVMRAAGHTMIFTPTYNEGIRKIKSLKNLDLCIVDLELGDKDGIRFVKEAHGINHNVKFIIISAFGTVRKKKMARDLGVGYFLDKPIDMDVLLKAVKNF